MKDFQSSGLPVSLPSHETSKMAEDEGVEPSGLFARVVSNHLCFAVEHTSSEWWERRESNPHGTESTES